MTEFRIVCKDTETKSIVGNAIHEKLVGCKDYIDNNIVLNIDLYSYTVVLLVDMENTKTIPVITFHKRKPKLSDKFKFVVCCHSNDNGETDLDPDIISNMFKDMAAELDAPITCYKANVDDDGDKEYLIVVAETDIGTKLDFDINFVNKNMKFYNGLLFSTVQ